MDTSWLEYCATDEQLKAFNDTGYLIVEDAISPEMVDALEEVADRLDAEERAKTGLAPHKMLSKFRTVIEDDILLELLDNKKVFPLALGYLRLEHPALYLAPHHVSPRTARYTAYPKRRALASRRRQTCPRDGTSTPATLTEGKLLVKRRYRP